MFAIEGHTTELKVSTFIAKLDHIKLVILSFFL